MSININFCPGRHGGNSPIVGRRAHELKEIRELVKKQPILKAFEKALHDSVEHEIQGEAHAVGHLYLIPYAKKREADQFVANLFSQYLTPYATSGINIKNAIDWTPHIYWGARFGGSSPGQAITKSRDVRAGINEWHIHAAVNEEGGVQGENYLPPHIIALHEIQHVEEKNKEERAEDYM